MMRPNKNNTIRLETRVSDLIVCYSKKISILVFSSKEISILANII